MGADVHRYRSFDVMQLERLMNFPNSVQAIPCAKTGKTVNPW